MELSAIGTGFNYALTCPAQSYFPLIPSASAPTTTTRKRILNAPPQLQQHHFSKNPGMNRNHRRQVVKGVTRSPTWPDKLPFLKLEGTLKVQDLNVILRNFGKQSRWNDLSQLFDWMQQNDKISVASFSSCIKFMGKSLNPMRALEIYSNIPDEAIKSNVFICNSVLSCLVRNGKFDISTKLFHKMKQNGLTPDVITYSTLLAGCIKVKHGYSKALDLVQELKYNGLQMDSVMYGTLLAVCASNNQCEEAESYFNQMKDEGHSPNIFHYSSLLNAYSAVGNYRKAEELVQDMKSLGLVPNKVIRTTLLKVYVRGGLFEKSRELLLELEALGYAEDEMPYCLLMDGLAKAGNINEARSIFDETKEKVLNLELCSSLIFYLGKTKAHPEAFSVYTMLKYGKRTMCKALHEKILHILLSGQLLKDAYVVVKDNTELISQAAIKKFANAFMKLGNINMINDVMKVIHGSGYKIDQELFQMAISRYIENPEKKDLLLQLLKWMPGQGYAVDSSTRNLILKNSHLFGRQLIAEILSRQQMMSKALKSH
ncbi:hypothetical protein GH714_004822 [Hevea brasiliensis]|uniref:PROP1-like PPR domain-containing protein n=1 Tax=Hevea brasiliensis TaxID=3981 RepID=A0A6A6L283_HEVBR|nr:hypothetical protein GH714_004822 [Hevea brasiliensis]